MLTGEMIGPSGCFPPEPDVAHSGVWVSDRFACPVCLSGGGRLSIEGIHFPELLARQGGSPSARYAVLAGDRLILQREISAAGPFVLTANLDGLHPAGAPGLRIESSGYFIPGHIGNSTDLRRLSWRLLRITATNWGCLDFTRFPELTSRHRFAPASQSAIDRYPRAPLLLALYRPHFRDCPDPGRTADLCWRDHIGNAPLAVAPDRLGEGSIRLPITHGFYDLRDPDVFLRQARLAQQHGIGGFCIHYDIFLHDEGLLDLALPIFRDSRIPSSYCVCLRSEPFVPTITDLRPQRTRHLARLFKDERYIRVREMPLVVLDHRPDASGQQDTASLVTALRNLRRHVETLGEARVYVLVRLRAATQEQLSLCCDDLGILEAGRPTGAGRCSPSQTFSIVEVAPSHHRTAVDDLPRSGQGDDLAPSEGVTGLDCALAAVGANSHAGNGIVFLDAWNDWHAGRYLEPDQTWGHAKLVALAAAVRNRFADGHWALCRELNATFRRRHGTAIVLHVYYEDMIDEIFDEYLVGLRDRCDLIVTCCVGIPREALLRMRGKFPDSFFLVTQNRGRDIRPFLLAVETILASGYALACKLHSKKSPHQESGRENRQASFRALISGASAILDLFQEEPGLAVVAPAACLTDLAASRQLVEQNEPWMQRLLRRAGRDDLLPDYRIRFPAGSMYWFRPSLLSGMLRAFSLDLDAFEAEAGQLDGTLAHAIERLICVAPAGEPPLHASTINVSTEGFGEIDLATWSRA